MGVNPRWNEEKDQRDQVFSFRRSLTAEDVERQPFPAVLSRASPFRVGARGRGGAGAAVRSGLGRFVSGSEWALCERAGPLGLAVLSHEPQKNARIRDVCHPGAGCSGREVTRAFSRTAAVLRDAGSL